MKPNAYRIFTVLLLATFSFWVGCSHNTPPELSSMQKQLNEKDNEIKQLASKNTNNENQLSLLAKENSEKDRQLKEFETKLDQQVKMRPCRTNLPPRRPSILPRPIRASVLQGF